MTVQGNEFGSWTSPITAKTLVEGVVRYAEIEVDGDELYWLEARPEEKGRQVFVRDSDNQDLYSAPFSARTTVHEYGGKCGAILNGVLYFSNYTDQHLYKVKIGEEPTLVTDLENMRFADMSIHPSGKWLYAVGEDHTNFPNIENLLVRVDLESGEVARIATGHDFYSSPRISPDGSRLCFYLWDHPNMPWDGTELWVATLDDMGCISELNKIAGGKEESVIEPSWSPDGVLYYASDRTNYWNLYDETGSLLLEMDGEFASPPWVFGSMNHAFLTIDGSPYIAATITEKGEDFLVLINRKTKDLKRIFLEFNFLSDIHSYKDGLIFFASSPFLPQRMVYFDPKTESCTLLRATKEYDISHEYISAPISIAFPTANNKEAYAFYYPPTNPNYGKETSGEKPPLIVACHGGPTAHVSPRFALSIQYWTSRGFALCDVNYGGSTGYGREYRNRLRGSWGVVDVEDCCNAAKYLIEKGLVDPHRLAIRGGSAGGFTTLACLAFTNVFQAGTDLFGVSDLIGLTECTHKFESRYNDTLVGPYPEDKEKYIRYSPAHSVSQISAPVLILQGDEDKIVPPSQSEVVYNALLKNCIPTAYIVYKGEQHGFRKAENIIHSLESELYFYCKIFGLPEPVGIPSIKIENL